MYNIKQLVGAVTVASISFGLAASSSNGDVIAAGSPNDSTTTEIDMLVTTYEEFNTFRGVDLSALDTELELGIVTVDTKDIDGGITRDGYVDYGVNEEGVHLVVASDGHGMDRFGIVVHDATANEFRFPVIVPVDASVVHEASGAIKVASSEGTTTLAPATAIDSAGEQLPASYQILNDELVVKVDLTNAVFPVLVDPVSASYWWGTQTWYSRSDVRASASWYGVIRIAAAVCYGMPGWARTACLNTVGAYTNWIYNTWMEAKAYNQCLWMKMTWTGQVIGIGRYACNWG